jgi:L-alanine-DL-glutamate epimerase-like enolase superfamily enzyme
MTRLTLEHSIERFAYRAPFRISGYLFEASQLLVVRLRDGAHRGRGEAAGVYFLGDDVPAMIAQIEQVRGEIEAGITREALQELMPAGGARNAVDCALWELEADRTGQPVWQVAGLGAPTPLVTAFTIGAGDPADMADAARDYTIAHALKLKLTGDLDIDCERVRAVRAVRPDVWLAVDANQGFAADELDALMPVLVAADVKLLEQPVRRGAEASLDGFVSPIPVAADESVLTSADLPTLPSAFNVFNIKLDKCGGLTEGLKMIALGKQLGLEAMVGNMMGSSLSMAPSFVVGQQCRVVDLDGPTFLAADRTPSIVYRDGKVWCGDEVWGPRQAGAQD